ncbi:TetR/AcrR family transcriptional regulator [Ancylobacter lacus]|uniref:TetR/AcrR family transcriptional regulator n=1 Tax=Ancylobacter lacus TaxID=2579970 RepID=UPI001BCF8B0B|nr:TetR/AcrR family transcriptional regulator [Ancylobacter lacus]MBS7539241.1 TetR family transcriptional regulator C-terminal domain-containing protein [Ancylobacter lacus]
MENPSPTREKILAAGIRALLEHGYEGTGLGPLLASVDVPKGSFYHFFPSKEDFAAAVLDAYVAHYRAHRLAVFGDATRTPMARLDAYIVHLEAEALGGTALAGCLYGVLAQSVGGLGPELRQRLAAAFERWEQDLAALIAEAQQAGEVDPALDPADTAAGLIDFYEGAIVRARAGGGAAAFRRLRRFAASLRWSG